MSMEKDANTPIDYPALLAELAARDLAKMIAEHGDTPATRESHAKQWDSDAPCPDCGSHLHFEC